MKVSTIHAFFVLALIGVLGPGRVESGTLVSAENSTAQVAKKISSSISQPDLPIGTASASAFSDDDSDGKKTKRQSGRGSAKKTQLPKSKVTNYKSPNGYMKVWESEPKSYSTSYHHETEEPTVSYSYSSDDSSDDGKTKKGGKSKKSKKYKEEEEEEEDSSAERERKAGSGSGGKRRQETSHNNYDEDHNSDAEEERNYRPKSSSKGNKRRPKQQHNDEPEGYYGGNQFNNPDDRYYDRKPNNDDASALYNRQSRRNNNNNYHKRAREPEYDEDYDHDLHPKKKSNRRDYDGPDRRPNRQPDFKDDEEEGDTYDTEDRYRKKTKDIIDRDTRYHQKERDSLEDAEEELEQNYRLSLDARSSGSKHKPYKKLVDSPEDEKFFRGFYDIVDDYGKYVEVAEPDAGSTARSRDARRKYGGDEEATDVSYDDKRNNKNPYYEESTRKPSSGRRLDAEVEQVDYEDVTSYPKQATSPSTTTGQRVANTDRRKHPDSEYDIDFEFNANDPFGHNSYKEYEAAMRNNKYLKPK